MYGDQMVACENWPAKNCKCKGQGHFGVYTKAADMKPTLDIQPNKPCPCSSGKKYKKCCQEMMTRMRRGGAAILVCSCVGKSQMVKNEEAMKMAERLQNMIREEMERTNG